MKVLIKFFYHLIFNYIITNFISFIDNQDSQLVGLEVSSSLLQSKGNIYVILHIM
jgi:hypothetical protein